MDHLIRFTAADGTDGSVVATSLDEALALAERLRNDDGALDVRLFRLTEVPVEFRAYYRAEVPATDREADHPAPVRELHASPPPYAVTHPSVAAAPAAAPAGPPAADAVGGPPPVPELVPRLVPHSPSEHPAANGRRLFSR
jgi:hypothetical protein